MNVKAMTWREALIDLPVSQLQLVGAYRGHGLPADPDRALG